jgi:hypothetical protein
VHVLSMYEGFLAHSPLIAHCWHARSCPAPGRGEGGGGRGDGGRGGLGTGRLETRSCGGSSCAATRCWRGSAVTSALAAKCGADERGRRKASRSASAVRPRMVRSMRRPRGDGPATGPPPRLDGGSSRLARGGVSGGCGRGGAGGIMERLGGERIVVADSQPSSSSLASFQLSLPSSSQPSVLRETRARTDIHWRAVGGVASVTRRGPTRTPASRGGPIQHCESRKTKRLRRGRPVEG